MGTDEFVELGIPELTTNIATNITDNSAVSGGDISDDGGAEIISKGVCWSVSSTPTIDDFITSDGTGAADFTSVIDGLESNTEYFVRAYATNSEGVGYGNEVSLKTGMFEQIEKVFEGDVVLTSQKEVDDFGDNNYTEISGSLEIRDSNNPSTIVDLSSLNSLSSIGADLILYENEILKDLGGLNNLNDFSGDIQLYSNDKLENIDALSQISIANFIHIFGNKSLSSLIGFHGLQEISLGISIQATTLIENLDGFKNVKIIENNIFIEQNVGLLDVSGLNELYLLIILILKVLMGLII